MSIYDSKEIILKNNSVIEENFSSENKNQIATVDDNFKKTNKAYELFLHHADSFVALTIDDIFKRNNSFFIPTKDKPFSNEIERFVSIIFEPNDVIEIRLIPSENSQSQKKPIYFGLAKDLSGFANTLKTFNTEEKRLNV